ncbi:fibronectin type III domain-containing protein [bacterium]|nr:fibronectin type III domain-containing protein [bacterium]
MNKIVKMCIACMTVGAAFLIFHFASYPLYAYSGIPSSGSIKGVYISGKTPSHLKEGDVDFWEGVVSSMTWQSTGTCWGKPVSLIPGNTYYYKYAIEYGTGSVTTRIWEQTNFWHSVYVGYENNVYVDGNFTKSIPASSVMDNWAGAPSPPQDPVVEVDDSRVKVKWTVPHFGGFGLLDNKGYLIYLSTDSINWKNYNDTSTLISPDAAQVEIESLKNNATYYLRLRSVDKYDYADIDINSELYPTSSAERTFRWNYSQTVKFRPNKRIKCRFALTYPGQDEISLSLNGRKYALKKEGEYYTSWVTLTEMEIYSYLYQSPSAEDPSGARLVKIIDIDGDGKFYVFDTWGVSTADSLPEAIIGWKIVSSTGDINFSWKKNPEYDDNVTVYKSTDGLNWSVVISTGGSGFLWNVSLAGKKYYFAIGSFLLQSAPQEVDTSTSSVVKIPEALFVSGIVDQKFTAEPYSDKVKITCSAPFKKNDSFAGIYWVLKSTYNRNIVQGSEIDWEKYEFIAKRKGFSPAEALKFYSKISDIPLQTFYLWNMNIFGNGEVYCSNPDVFVTPQEVDKNGGYYCKTAGIFFPKKSLSAKKAFLTIYNREEIADANKFKELSAKIEAANTQAGQISYQQEMATSTIFMFNLRKMDGTLLEEEFRRPVEITLPYPAGADTENIAAFYLDEEYNFWKRVKIGPHFEKPEINISSVTITFRTMHFSVFALMTVAGEPDLSNAVIYPNPFKPFDKKFETGAVYSAGNQYSGIHFTKLTSNTKIRIFTIDGVPVRGGLQSSNDGTCVWDAKNDDGRDVSSGLYLILAEDPNALGEKKFIGKAAIIR